jgi:hypothetical protein
MVGGLNAVVQNNTAHEIAYQHNLIYCEVVIRMSNAYKISEHKLKCEKNASSKSKFALFVLLIDKDSTEITCQLFRGSELEQPATFIIVFQVQNNEKIGTANRHLEMFACAF